MRALMASLARTTNAGARAEARAAVVVPAAKSGAPRLEATHLELMADAEPRGYPFLKAAPRSPLVVFDGAGKADAADRLATGTYVAQVVATLAAESELDAADATRAVETLGDAPQEPGGAGR